LKGEGKRLTLEGGKGGRTAGNPNLGGRGDGEHLDWGLVFRGYVEGVAIPREKGVRTGGGGFVDPLLTGVEGGWKPKLEKGKGVELDDHGPELPA